MIGNKLIRETNFRNKRRKSHSSRFSGILFPVQQMKMNTSIKRIVVNFFLSFSLRQLWPCSVKFSNSKDSMRLVTLNNWNHSRNQTSQLFMLLIRRVIQLPFKHLHLQECQMKALSFIINGLLIPSVSDFSLRLS